MKDLRFDRKDKAINLRRNGLSIGVIEKRLGINRSTLSGWFKNIELTKKQKEKLHQRWLDGLALGRKKAVAWHNKQKINRLQLAREEAGKVLDSINIENKDILEIIIAMLYLGEGFKSSDQTGMGNSDPLILKTFIKVLQNNYGLDLKDFRCDLHLRADQDPLEMKKFWSKELNISVDNFKYVSNDKRTLGSKTHANYKGVCSVFCGRVAIKRKLLYISQGLCERLVKMRL
ncbi:MAG: hypothetical protein AAB847_01930 [Patescibacteria group bacterium]